MDSVLFYERPMGQGLAIRCTQCNAILSLLSAGLSLSPKEALELFGVGRLAARIFDLRERGHKIVFDWASTNGKRYARYRLVKT